MSQNQINANIELHEKVADVYGKQHPEIYNEIEQKRLYQSLSDALDYCSVPRTEVRALDYGCGDGNLTRHLLQLGCHVTTADVTPSFTRIASGIDPSRTTPLVLNGRDMEGVGDNTFDLVVTYSVLHHIPDYLHAIREMIRVLKPGGCIYIDHERCESFWHPDTERDAFFAAYTVQPSFADYLKRLASPSWWSNRIRKMKNPRYQAEGDIHVWPDDHIEWPEIRNVFSDAGIKIIIDEDYLMYLPHYDVEAFKESAKNIADLRLVLGRKRDAN